MKTTTTIIIHRKDVLKHNPCNEGLKWFDSMMNNSDPSSPFLEIKGGMPELLECFMNNETSKFLVWAKMKRIIPVLNLSGMNLSKKDLSWINFSYVDFSGANLSSTNLTETTLVGANLKNANLTDANLFGATLKNADLTGAKRLPKNHYIPGWKIVSGSGLLQPE